jgi:hypothetical protein
MIELAQRVVAWLMNRIRINQVQQDMREGVPVFIKRRRAGAQIVLWFANARVNCSSIHRIEPRLQSLREIIHRVSAGTQC